MQGRDKYNGSDCKRNHNRYFRAVCLREYEFSILQVLFSDLKIALDSIFSLPGCIHSNVLYRVKKSILAVTQNLPLSPSDTFY